jgi:putative MATE family efflux protein
MEGEGALVLAGLGIVIPVINVINAFGNLVGTGGGPLLSITMGRRDLKEAERILGNSIYMLISLAFLLTFIFLVWETPILRLLGADSETFLYASKYLKIYALGNIFVMLSLGLTPFLTAQGFNKISMRNTCIGTITNLILDPILIYRFHMGIAGAAIATVVSQGITAVLAVRFLLSQKTKIRLIFVKPSLRIIKNISSLGLASFFMGASESVVQAIVYNQLLLYGDSNYVAATSIMYSIVQFIFMAIQGIGQGAQPIISYNYGAKENKRVKQTLKIMLLSCSAICLIVVLFIEAVPDLLMKLFTNDARVIEIGVFGLRIFVLGRVVTGLHMGLQDFFRSVGDAKTAIFNAAARKFLFLIPLVYILPGLGLGTTGVYWAECIADLMAVVVSGSSYYRRREKIFLQKV